MMKNYIKRFLNISFVFLLFILTGCVDLPNDVVLPEWDVDLNLPLLRKDYTIEDLINSEEQSLIHADTLNDIYIIQSEAFNVSTDVAKYLTMEGESSNENIPITDLGADSTVIYFGFNDGTKLESAVLNSGIFTFNAVNQSAVDSVTINLKIPGIIGQQGKMLEVSIPLAPLETKEVYYNIKDHAYAEPLSQPPSQKGKIGLLASMDSPQLFTRALLDVYSSNIGFKSAKGYIPRKNLGTETQAFKLNIGNDVFDFRDKVTLKQAALNLNAKFLTSSSTPFDVELSNFKIYGKRNDGTEKELLLNSGYKKSFRLVNGNLSTQFNETNSNISEFITFMPDTVTISAEYIMNPDDDAAYHTITNQDSLIFTADFSTQSSLALKNSTIVDTTEIVISESDRQEIKNAQSAQLSIEVDNGIPLTSFIKIALFDKNFNQLFVITKDLSGADSLKFTGAAINPSTGEVISSTGTTQTIDLNKNEIEMLSDSYYTINSVSVRSKDAYTGTSAPYINIRPSQLIKIKSVGKIKYRVNSDD